MLRCNIIIYTNVNYSIADSQYKFEYEAKTASNDILNPFFPIILIPWININHYKLLFPKEKNNKIEKIIFYNLMKKLNTKAMK